MSLTNKIILVLIAFVFAQCAYEPVYRIVFGRASYSTEAVYKVPNSDYEIVLKRRAAHVFLAEYERKIVLRKRQKEITEQNAAFDTGGYSRMSLYRISETQYSLNGKLSHDCFKIDVNKQKITEYEFNEKPIDNGFIGIFDKDEERNWRFITADEIVRNKTEILQ